ncbi:putative PurR-regulated permease PerM [Isoptericola sp. CG 20/1183]|uniref:PurR-regulated permease PerM n=1 Tax=Isoptericola halotolerans TaxID=300560 RepID=A0ABX5EFE4_9MICO|nr:MULTISPECIES: AI-2E family transporter [Isoptericola]PRZ08136.1 putative PurR-regulated permease PerM [Isoptericola halotolerans]PRZ08933.1 putative PurR-regulated permease PerM [Isoptericola sp. CG 20/1183]
MPDDGGTPPHVPDDDAPDGGTRPVLHDSARPPRWVPRVLVMGAVAVFVAAWTWTALGQLTTLFVYLLIAFFLTLALEPVVTWLVRHGWRRGLAAGTAFFGSVIVALVVLALFGNLFIQQLVQLVGVLPELYVAASGRIQETFDVELPASDDLLAQLVTEYGTDVATGTIAVGTTVVGLVFAALTIGLVTYYLMAAGPQFRAAVCRWLSPGRQTEVLRLWEITQVKVSDFISSRIVLAALSAAFTAVFLVIVGTPYALPLALFTGIVSQFIPTIGTYIGGALPVAVALTSQGVPQAVAVLAFIIAYQQLENLYFSPKVSARALEMNPAMSFVAVLAFGAVFGALGAFLALPIAATIQAVANTYLQRHELIDSELLRDPERAPSRKGSRRARNARAAREAARTVDQRRADGLE